MALIRSRRRWGDRSARLAAVALIAAVTLMPALAGARDERSIDELRNRLDQIQKELDAATAKVETLRTEENGLRLSVARIDDELRNLQSQRVRLEDRAVAAARSLYMTSSADSLEFLLSAESFSAMAVRSQALEHISEGDTNALIDLAEAESRLVRLQADLIEKGDRLTVTRARLDLESDQLQDRFKEVSREYSILQKKLAAAARRRALAVAGGNVHFSASGMACPIAAPNSFIDSWGFPRDGGARSHEGTDIMAAMGAPVVAITDGKITFEGTGVTAGNWIVLSGSDGHSYWYMHNEENLVSGGHVEAGERIATVGDTGNAAGGPPHVHFEYHPGEGGPVNPYRLLVEVCRG